MQREKNGAVWCAMISCIINLYLPRSSGILLMRVTTSDFMYESYSRSIQASTSRQCCSVYRLSPLVICSKQPGIAVGYNVTNRLWRDRGPTVAEWIENWEHPGSGSGQPAWTCRPLTWANTVPDRQHTGRCEKAKSLNLFLINLPQLGGSPGWRVAQD